MMKNKQLAGILTVCSFGCTLIAFCLPFFRISSLGVSLPYWLPESVAELFNVFVNINMGFREGDFYLFEIVKNLYNSNENAVFLLVTISTFILPALKFISISLQICNATGVISNRFLYYINWCSLADIFLLSFFIVIFKSSGLGIEMHTAPGATAFIFAVCLSSAAIIIIEASGSPLKKDTIEKGGGLMMKRFGLFLGLILLVGAGILSSFFFLNRDTFFVKFKDTKGIQAGDSVFCGERQVGSIVSVTAKNGKPSVEVSVNSDFRAEQLSTTSSFFIAPDMSRKGHQCLLTRSSVISEGSPIQNGQILPGIDNPLLWDGLSFADDLHGIIQEPLRSFKNTAVDSIKELNSIISKTKGNDLKQTTASLKEKLSRIFVESDE